MDNKFKWAGIAICLVGLLFFALAGHEAIVAPKIFEKHDTWPISTKTIWFSVLGLFSVLTGWFMIVYKYSKK